MNIYSQRRFHCCVYALIALWAALHLLWHSLDNMPFFADQVFYAEGAVRIVRNFINLSWLDFFRSLNDVTEMLRPPGSSILLAPFAALFHYNAQWMKASSLIWYFVMFGAVYQMGKKIF